MINKEVYDKFKEMDNIDFYLYFYSLKDKKSTNRNYTRTESHISPNRDRILIYELIRVQPYNQCAYYTDEVSEYLDSMQSLFDIVKWDNERQWYLPDGEDKIYNYCKHNYFSDKKTSEILAVYRYFWMYTL
jgi:hypothetical protein